MSSSFSSNFLLSALRADDLAVLEPHLTRVPLVKGAALETTGETVTQVYFVESGIVSIVASVGEHDSTECGVIGWEGVTGIAVILGNHHAALDAQVQIDGSALRIEAQMLRSAMEQSEFLSQLLLRFAHVFSVQIAHTALANGRATIEERLARWLLMVHDRVDGDEASITHDYVAMMLGVRRPGVTDAMHALEGKGLIRSLRGVVRIVDREGLEGLAGGIYGAPEQAYRRMIGSPA